MRRALAACWLMVLGCPDQPVVLSEAPLVSSPLVGVSPEASLYLPDTVEDEPVHIIATVWDPDQPVITLLCHLTSDLDGELYVGNPEDGGMIEWTGMLSPGVHRISIEVTDAYDNTVVMEAEIAVIGPNHAPDCAIASPLDGEVFDSGASIWFEAIVADADQDPITTLWWSSHHGAMVIGDAFPFILEDGVHDIAIEVTDDREGLCVDTLTIQIGN